MDEMRAKLLGQFGQMSLERLEVLNLRLVTLEEKPSDAEAIEELMREIHTMKGESRMLGLTTLNTVSHRVEDVLVWCRDRGFRVPQEATDLCFSGFDLMGGICVGESLEEVDPGLVEAVDELLAAIDGYLTENADLEALEPVEPAASAEPEAEAESSEPADTPAARSTSKSDGAFLRVGVGKLDRLTHFSGDLFLRQAHQEQVASDLERVTEDLLSAVVKMRPGEPLDRRDITRLSAYGKELRARLAALRDASFMSHMRLRELQDDISQIRLIEVESLFSRYVRAARDIAKEQGKQVRVVIDGGDVAADNHVLESLADPLLHLIRNSVDHGLETPDVRVAAGKPEQGTLKLTARHVGAQVEILIQDDGGGIDPNRVRAKLEQKDLLSKTELDGMSKEAILQQLFRSGFSTRDKVSDLSGRGVGLDVVRKNVEAMGGTANVESHVGKGSTFRLMVPISAAVTQAFVVRLSVGLFGIQSMAIDTIVDEGDLVVEAAAEGESLLLGEADRVPLYDLELMLGFPGVERDVALRSDVIVVRQAGRRLGLRAGRLLGERTVVQQSMSAFVQGLPLTSGTALIEGGELVTLLQMHAVFDQALDAAGRRRKITKSAAQEANVRKRVLLVEDSDLTREMLASTLSKMGYEVWEAVNGQDGLDKLDRRTPDIIVTDLDMPILDGFGLIRAVRARPRLAELPLIVLSTRDSAEDKRHAAQAGADAYLVKSAFNEDALSQTFASLLIDD